MLSIERKFYERLLACPPLQRHCASSKAAPTQTLDLLWVFFWFFLVWELNREAALH